MRMLAGGNSGGDGNNVPTVHEFLASCDLGHHAMALAAALQVR